jgi:calcium channel MID1
MDEPSLLGDTTSNLAIVFSPLLLNVSIAKPEFPNYTLPPANISMESVPPSLATMNVSYALFPTSSSPVGRLPHTGCALRASNSTGNTINGTLWQHEPTAWRTEWLIGGLTPATNYTLIAIVNDTHVSKPMNFATKSGRCQYSITRLIIHVLPSTASFACPLVHQLPFCPGVSYAIPLGAAPQFPLVAHDASTLPDTIIEPLLEYMTNFTVALSTFACGRDLYSPLQTCADCQVAYRKWLCTTQFPRCTENLPQQLDQAPALVVQKANTPQRNLNFPNLTSDVAVLLPCIETCQAVDRACPNFLGFKCPVVRFNAAKSYGVGFIDAVGSGVAGGGSTGLAQDSYGNLWCNSG